MKLIFGELLFTANIEEQSAQKYMKQCQASFIVIAAIYIAPQSASYTLLLCSWQQVSKIMQIGWQ